MANRPLSPWRYLVDPETGCWLWQRATNGAGYGVLVVDARRWLAHRYYFTRLRGPIPDALELDHAVCQTPECCNPWHVEPVTHAENLRRGRSTKLRAAVGRIRERLGAGEAPAALAAEHGVTAESIRAIGRGSRWRFT